MLRALSRGFMQERDPVYEVAILVRGGQVVRPTALESLTVGPSGLVAATDETVLSRLHQTRSLPGSLPGLPWTHPHYVLVCAGYIFIFCM